MNDKGFGIMAVMGFCQDSLDVTAMDDLSEGKASDIPPLESSLFELRVFLSTQTHDGFHIEPVVDSHNNVQARIDEIEGIGDDRSLLGILLEFLVADGLIFKVAPELLVCHLPLGLSIDIFDVGMPEDVFVSENHVKDLPPEIVVRPKGHLEKVINVKRALFPENLDFGGEQGSGNLPFECGDPEGHKQMNLMMMSSPFKITNWWYIYPPHPLNHPDMIHPIQHCPCPYRIN